MTRTERIIATVTSIPKGSRFRAVISSSAGLNSFEAAEASKALRAKFPGSQCNPKQARRGWTVMGRTLA